MKSFIHYSIDGDPSERFPIPKMELPSYIHCKESIAEYVAESFIDSNGYEGEHEVIVHLYEKDCLDSLIGSFVVSIEAELIYDARRIKN